MAKMIVIDEQRCLACKTCVLECAMAHSQAGTLVEALSAETLPQPRVHVEPLGDFGMPLQCRHCEDAPCIMVCPTEAIRRFDPDGPVILDQQRCIGCKFCMMVCPFGVIDISRDGKAMIKCDLCLKLTEAGQEEPQPACVAACPTGALRFEEVTEYLRRRRRQAVERLAAGAERNVKIPSETPDEPDGG